MIDDWTIVAHAVSGGLGFLLTFLLIPRLIRSFGRRGIIGIDMNKIDRPQVAEMGGVAVVIGFFVGVSSILMYAAITKGNFIADAPLILAALIATLGCAMVGVVDDLFELRQRVKAALPVLFGIPLGVYVVDTAIHLPRGVDIELGILSIPVIAFMVSAGANAANMLEGFNGLGSGLGLIMSGTLIVLSVLTPHPDALVLLVPFFGATLAFFLFNKYPSRVFPGDTFTLFMGGVLVCSAVIMGFKEVGALLFIPMILEFLVKARHRFTKECYGVPQPDQTLVHEGEIGSLTHLLMRGGRATERRVVGVLWSLESLICVLVLALVLF